MDRIKLALTPHPDELKGKEHSGIAQVILNWARYLPEFGIDIVPMNSPDRADISVGHSASNPTADIHFSHGLLWTEEMELGDYAYEVNADLVQAAKNAIRVIVPSLWVADVYRRDMRIDPDIIAHGINLEDWEHDYPRGDYVLYTKNRTKDGLDPGQINDVAKLLPHVTFYTTFATRESPPNVITYGGTVPWSEMKRHIKKAGVVFMPDRETWGIAAAEALAAGVPVVSTSAGAVKEFVEHGIEGYIYRDRNLADAVQGIQYCLEHGEVLGTNARVKARDLTWTKSVGMSADVIKEEIDNLAERKRLFAIDDLHTVAVVITCHNYGHVVDGAIQSALDQTHKVKEVIVVDDSSTDNTREVVEDFRSRDDRVSYRRVDVQSVAEARNEGIYNTDCRYIVILDGDDEIRKDFVKDCFTGLTGARRIAFAYSSTEVVLEDTGEILMPPNLAEETGKRAHKPWPTEEVDKQFIPGMANQFPACSMFKRDALLAMGGYRSRYSRDDEGRSKGAGTEDAELYLRLLAHGYDGKMVRPTVDNLWVHKHGKGTVSGADGFKEVNWRAWKPYTRDFKFPFAAAATPKRLSHPVRSYEPKVSVIIPVHPDHTWKLRNALDSIEAQNYRNWEAVVVWDFHANYHILDYYEQAYPFVRWGFTNSKGPGAARNRGVELASSDFITFLDADDYYSPEFFDHVNPDTWRKYQRIVYSQYYSRMNRDMHERLGGEIVKDEGSHVVVDASFRDFDRKRALTRPEGERPYVWSGVNVFMPRIWHEEIGGFDESLRTWEDCFYLLELAWRGYSFYRVRKPLWVYSFTDGARRQKSAGHEPELMAYFQERFDEIFSASDEFDEWDVEEYAM
jgi:glycosyltransferase involved in cell wall biosynthesis